MNNRIRGIFAIFIRISDFLIHVPLPDPDAQSIIPRRRTRSARFLDFPSVLEASTFFLSQRTPKMSFFVVFPVG
jgi:hypothetical protein